MKTKTLLKGFIGILLSLGLVVFSIYLHEGIHWLAFLLEPNIEPISFHVLDSTSFNNGFLGYVGFKGTPTIDLIYHELLAVLFQTLFLCLSQYGLIKIFARRKK